MLQTLINTKAQLEQKRNEIMNRVEPELKDILDQIAKVDEQITATITPIATNHRTALNKETGTIDFTIDGVKVKHDVPKRVEWDQNQLAGIRERIIAGNADPGEYMATVYKVKETNYKAWPSFIKDIFTPARTVKYGTPRITFEIVEPYAAVVPASQVGLVGIPGGRR